MPHTPPFYAVRGGPHPGVYSSWDEASRHTQGHSGALCKKFRDRASAEAFVGIQPTGAEGTGREQAPRPAEAAAPKSAPLRAHTPTAASALVAAAAAKGRIYLKVPFLEKDEAKALGAKWDPVRKSWFSESAADLTRLLQRWQVAGEDAPSPTRPAQVDKVPTPCASSPAKRKMLAAGSPDELYLFIDGSCRGNIKVAERNNPAGWGVLVVSGHGKEEGRGHVVAELFGPVILDRDSPFYLGAEVGSNNTGELSGICEALLWLRDQEHSARPAVICYDSKYAAKIATNEFKAQKNQLLAKTAQSLLKEVQKQRQVALRHVKGHSGHLGNEAVDRLANRGAVGERCGTGRWRLPGVGGEPTAAAAPTPAAAVTRAVGSAAAALALAAAAASGDCGAVAAAAAAAAETPAEPSAKRRRTAAA